MKYVHQLNGSPCRRSVNKVTYQQICNWFVNQRAILRSRQQQNTAQLTLNRPASATLLNNSLTNISLANNELSLLRNSFSSFVNNGLNGTETSVNNDINVAGATNIPLSSIPVDIRSKFNGSNGYNPLLDNHSDGEVIFNVNIFF